TSPSGTTSIITLLNAGGAADNDFYTGNAAIKLSNPYNLNNPNLRPSAGSPALSGANFTETALSDPFFTPTQYVGALAKSASQNWATLWTNFVPTKTDYSGACPCTAAAAAIAVTEAENAAASRGEVSIYPNPARGNFTINTNGFAGNITVKVTNANGLVVYNKQSAVTAKGSVNVSLNNATAGLYFVTVTNGTETTTKKINIIQ
ncbi:MAG TPA: T9SS type A sorting domain-containing protein, partial [Panacibacter sp.]|nr:T9SS type A sorting domain-containing protein [Panacibacter sp.]